MSDIDGVSCLDATDNHYDGILYAMSPASSWPGRSAARSTSMGPRIISSCRTPQAASLISAGTAGIQYRLGYIPETMDLDYHCIVTKSNQQYGLQLNNQNTWQFFEFENKQGWASTDAPATVNTWKYVVGVRSGAKTVYLCGRRARRQRHYPYSRCFASIHQRQRMRREARQRNEPLVERHDRRGQDLQLVKQHKLIKLCYMNQKPSDALVTFK